MFLTNVPLGVFDVWLQAVREGNIVDVLYRAGQSHEVVDRGFIPEAYAAPTTRVRTVEFFAGQDDGSATNDNQNAQQNFTQESFRINESTVDIIDAYVEVSVEIGATTATTYGSGFIYFDACTSSCTPSPAAFTSTAGLGTNSGEAQTIRFLAEVTSEGDLAAYTGGGTVKDFQVGYCFGTGGTCSGTTAANIQGANAKLVITYTYDPTSSTQTNTVLYPLQRYGNDSGSATSTQATCTIDSNCPTFSYNAAVPEANVQLSQWFYLQTSINANSTTDWQTISDIGTGANTNTAYFEEALTNNGGWVNVLRSGVAGFATGTAQSLEISTNASNAYTLGGEIYYTYSYSESAPTKTKTVVFPVGEVCTTGCTSKSSLTGSTVYFPEAGVNVEKAWFRVHTSDGGVTTAGTLALTTKVGSNSETSATNYSFASDTQGVTDDGYFVHVVPASDYTELEAATASAGKAVQMTAQWTASAGGAVSAELLITYTFTDETDGYLTTQNLFAGQRTSAAGTSYSTATGDINPSFPEDEGTITFRGASHRAFAKDASSTANGTIGSAFTLNPSACSASNTSTPVTDNEITRVMFWKNVTTITNDEADTYTACYSTGQNSIQGGTIAITHQWDAPVAMTFVVSHDNFPNISPGTPVFATTTLSVNTSNATGWYVTLSGDDQSPTNTVMDLTTDAAVGITDQAEWIPGTATTSAGNAVRISSLDSSGDVLAFRVMSASGSVAFRAATWWGSADNYTDSASTLWAGIASSTIARQIGNSSVTSGGVPVLSTVLYYLDVPLTQQQGTYTGGLTYTATANP